MATNYEKKFDAQTNSTFAFTFNAANKAPIIAKRIFNTKADAESYANNVNDNAVEGLLITVIADNAENNGAYMIESIATAEGGTAKLVKLASSSATEEGQSELDARIADLEDADVTGSNAIVVSASSAKDAKSISLKLNDVTESVVLTQSDSGLTASLKFNNPSEGVVLSQDASGLTASMQWGSF